MAIHSEEKISDAEPEANHTTHEQRSDGGVNEPKGSLAGVLEKNELGEEAEVGTTATANDNSANCLETGSTDNVTADLEKSKKPEEVAPEPPYSILSEPRKKITIVIASFAAFISPVSGNIYYPSLGALANNYHVSNSTINLTVTVYMVSRNPKHCKAAL